MAGRAGFRLAFEPRFGAYFHAMPSTSVLGLFIGGRSRRMGYFPKGLLQHPTASGMSIVEHWRQMAQELGLECVLVGESPVYSHLGLPMLPDQPAGIGPLGGLHAFLEHVRERKAEPAPDAIAVACDMPYVTLPLLSRLRSLRCERPILAPRHPHTRIWEPLFARYVPSLSLPLIADCCALRKTSLQALLDRAEADVLPLSDDEWLQLRDWDSPSDID